MPPCVLAIGDVHDSVYWRDIVKFRRPGDKVVFLGDYFDKRGTRKTAFARDDAANFLHICNYARNDPDVTLLVGNHDLQYTPWDVEGTASVNITKYPTLRALVMRNIDLLEMAKIYEVNGRPTIFSHAGITNAFLHENGCHDPYSINKLWRQYPEAFSFRTTLPPGYENEELDLHGDNVFQPPTWIRPDALMADPVPAFDQVVGHTYYADPWEALPLGKSNTLHIVCTLGPNNYYICGQ